MDIQKLDRAIQLLTELKKEFVSETTTKTQAAEPNDYDTFEKLKVALNSDKWAEAVNPNLLCQPDSENDKMERAKGIIELMIEQDLKDLKFLDIGCGEGHVVDVSANHKTIVSVGYDIQSSPHWEQFEAKPNLTFTDNFETVKAGAPYDVILIFDVLDHIQNEIPTDLLAKAKELLSDKGKIYLRLHPWSSRHATHLYYDLNKAFTHLVFTERELKELIPESKYAWTNIGVLFPIKIYSEWISKAKLKILNRRDITEKVEPFFKIPKIAERIMQHTNTKTFPEFQLGIQFVDYVLEKA